jgi:NAD(P)-dependent dehydrogenase (short-subunit alcohol dehydrogenase family)
MPHPQYTSAEELAHPPAGTPAADEGRRRYTTSKLCNVLFAYELDRRLEHGARGITVTVFDPGLMPGSGLARQYSPLAKFAWRYVFPVLRVLPNVNSTRVSGRRLAALAVDPAFDAVTGTYFEGAKAIRSSADSYDQELARDLWDTSERLVARVIA